MLSLEVGCLDRDGENVVQVQLIGNPVLLKSLDKQRGFGSMEGLCGL